ncbi:MAG: hypothetical protein ACLQNE_31480 [Thermoguttaceae bacterium]
MATSKSFDLRWMNGWAFGPDHFSNFCAERNRRRSALVSCPVSVLRLPRAMGLNIRVIRVIRGSPEAVPLDLQ